MSLDGVFVAGMWAALVYMIILLLDAIVGSVEFLKLYGWRATIKAFLHWSDPHDDDDPEVFV